MKKRLVFVLVAFLSISATSLVPSGSGWSEPTKPQAPKQGVEDDDPDLPRFLQGKGFDKEKYMRLRDEHLMRLRGLPHKLPYDPRMKAIQQMDGMERELARRRPQRQQSTWKPLGPAPIPNGQVGPQETVPTEIFPVSGRASAVDVHPTNPDIVYLGTAAGGFYRSTDGGGSWTELLGQSPASSIGAVAVAPSQPDTVFVGTGESSLSRGGFTGVGIYRIDDAASASPRITGPFGVAEFQNRVVSKIAVHPTDPNIIFASSANGNAGYFGSAGVVSTVNRGVFRSTDALSPNPTFNKLILGLPSGNENEQVMDLALDPGNPNLLMCSVRETTQGQSDGGVHRTTNALAANPKFTQTLALPPGIRAELAIARVGGNVTVLAATGETTPGCNAAGLVRKSTDGGASWPMTLTAASGFCGGQCFYNIAVAIDPTDPNRIYLGGQSNARAFGGCQAITYRRSTDGGTTFSDPFSHEGIHPDVHALQVAPSKPSVVYLTCDGGVWRSTDGGNVWTSRNAGGINSVQFMGLALHSTDREFLIGGCQDNGTNLRRADGSWLRVDRGDGGQSAIDQTSEGTTEVTMYHTYFNQTGNIVGFSRALNLSEANDEGWPFFGFLSGANSNNGIAGNEPVLFYAPLTLGPGKPNTVYFGTDRLYRSTDRGETMKVVSQGPLVQGFPLSCIGIAPQDDNVRIVGLTNGALFKTTTGSSTLQDADPNNVIINGYPTRVVIDPNNSNTAYVVLSNFLGTISHIWKTNNLSANPPTWVSAGEGLPDVPFNAFAVDPEDSKHLYAGSDIGVFRSLDGGVSWEPFSDGLPRVPVFELTIHKRHRLLRIATHGRGMWELQLAQGPDTTPPTVKVLAPNGGERFESGGKLSVTWTSTDDRAVQRQEVSLSTDGGKTFDVSAASGLGGSLTAFEFVLPASLVSQTARVRVAAQDEAGNRASDDSDADFTVVNTPDTTAPTVKVLTPNGGETATAGRTLSITWTATDNRAVTSQSVTLSTDGGGTFAVPVASGLGGGLTSFSFTIPATAASTRARVRVTAADAAGNIGNDVSDADFTIRAADTVAPTVKVLSPNGKEKVKTGTIARITWQSTDNVAVTSHDVLFSADGGATFPVALATGLVGTVQSFDALIPAQAATKTARIRVVARDAAGNEGRDDSDANFKIKGK